MEGWIANAERRTALPELLLFGRVVPVDEGRVVYSFPETGSDEMVAIECVLVSRVDAELAQSRTGVVLSRGGSVLGRVQLGPHLGAPGSPGRSAPTPWAPPTHVGWTYEMDPRLSPPTSSRRSLQTPPTR